MRPILLLDVSVVVLLVRSATCQLDLLLVAPPLQVSVDKLRTIVRVQAQEPEGESSLYRIQRLLHRNLAFPQ